MEWKNMDKKAMAPNRTKIHGNLIKKLYDKVAGCIVCLWDASYSTVFIYLFIFLESFDNPTQPIYATAAWGNMLILRK